MTWRSFTRICFALLLALFLLAAFSVLQRKSAPAGPPWMLCLAEETSGQEELAGCLPEARISFFTLPEERQAGFVLPAAWDPSRLRLFLSGVEEVRIGDRFYHSGDRVSLELGTPFEIIPLGYTPLLVTVRQTGGLPVLFLQTESGGSGAIHADKTVREPGRLLMTAADGSVLYREPLSAVRTRGNASFYHNKKPYQFKLEKNLPLIEDRPGKTWILLANAMDRAEIRNTLALDLARYCGAFAYTPRTQPVDLYLNHDYRGCYLLTEKVEVTGSRVGIRDLEKETKRLNPGLDLGALEAEGELEYGPGARKYRALPVEPEDLTGGYLLFLDKPRRYATEACGFVTDRGCAFTPQEPKYLSRAQTEYIASLFQRIEDALFQADGVDPVSGQHYTELLDLPSLVSRCLIAEVLDDYDGPFSYFYKDSDAVDPKVYTGPVWDLDNTLGLWIYQNDPAALHLFRDGGAEWSWLAQAARHDDFRAEARERYRRIFRPAVQILLGRERDPAGILRSVDEYAAEVAVSAQADFFRWRDPPLSRYLYENYYDTGTGDSFEEQVAYLKAYLALRLEALDAFFPAE